jgi:prevent-host-death family protein
MSNSILSISEAQKEFAHLPEKFEEQPGTVTITRYGKPVMTVLPYNTYKFLLETVDSLRETIKTLQDAG